MYTLFFLLIIQWSAASIWFFFLIPQLLRSSAKKNFSKTLSLPASFLKVSNRFIKRNRIASSITSHQNTMSRQVMIISLGGGMWCMTTTKWSIFVESTFASYLMCWFSYGDSRSWHWFGDDMMRVRVSGVGWDGGWAGTYKDRSCGWDDGCVRVISPRVDIVSLCCRIHDGVWSDDIFRWKHAWVVVVDDSGWMCRLNSGSADSSYVFSDDVFWFLVHEDSDVVA